MDFERSQPLKVHKNYVIRALRDAPEKVGIFLPGYTGTEGGDCHDHVEQARKEGREAERTEAQAQVLGLAADLLSQPEKTVSSHDFARVLKAALEKPAHDNVVARLLTTAAKEALEAAAHATLEGGWGESPKIPLWAATRVSEWLLERAKKGVTT